jgi:hypothetical protein
MIVLLRLAGGLYRSILLVRQEAPPVEIRQVRITYYYNIPYLVISYIV